MSPKPSSAESSSSDSSFFSSALAAAGASEAAGAAAANFSGLAMRSLSSSISDQLYSVEMATARTFL